MLRQLHQNSRALIGVRQLHQLSRALIEVRQPQEIATPIPVVIDRRVEARVEIEADDRGHFYVDARINGHVMRALIDTGATDVSIDRMSAYRAGLRPRASDYTERVATSDGAIMCAPVTFGCIEIGGIAVRGVRGHVGPGGAYDEATIGMSLLSRLARCEIAGGRMALEG